MAAEEGPQASESPFLRQLASSHKKTRDTAFQHLTTYLHHKRDFTPLDMLKLWKGLFYCMWMADKPLVQQRLATSMSALPHGLSDQTFAIFVRAFWVTIAREWRGIDALRMNKFLLLVRLYLGAGLGRFVDEDKHKRKRREGLEAHVGMLEEVPMRAEGEVEPEHVSVPDGLRYHLLDIWVDEVAKLGVLDDRGDKEGEELVEVLMRPVRSLAKESPTKAVRKRAEETLLDGRLTGEGESEVEEDEGHSETEDMDADPDSQNGGDADGEEWAGFGD